MNQENGVRRGCAGNPDGGAGPADRPPPEKKMNLPRRGLDKNKIFVIIYNEGYIDIV